MGNDGGSIPTRRELVKSAARQPTVSELKASALEALAHAWQTDPVSGKLLDLDNAASDWCGRLYNFETIVRGLLPGDGADEDTANKDGAANTDAENNTTGLTFTDTGIRSLRDVVRLQCQRIRPAGSGSTSKTGPVNSGSNGDTGPPPTWQCPVTLKPLGPGTKAVYLVPCGHMFAEAAVEAALPDLLCPACSEPFTADNVIAVLPTDASGVREKLRQRMDRLRAEGLTHSLKKEKKDKKDKKDKKKKRKAEDDETTVDEAPQAKREAGGARTLQSSDRDRLASRLSGINNAAAASLTAKVLAEQERMQKQKMGVR